MLASYSSIGIYWWGLLLKGLLLQVGSVSVIQESDFTGGVC